MVSNLDLVSMIFTLSLFNNYIAISAKCLDDTAINRNHNGFCIGSALISYFSLISPHLWRTNHSN